MQTTSTLHEIPDQPQLEKKFLRLRTINRIVLAGVILVDLYLLYELIFDYSIGMKLVAMVSLTIISSLFWISSLDLILQEKAPLDSLGNEETIGKYSVGEIKTLVSSVFEAYQDKREIPHIYITYDGDTNVLVLNSLLFNRIKSQNAIYISEPLFHIFEKDELKAIISHELGHFYKYTSPVQRMKTFIFFLAGLLPVSLHASDPFATIWGFIGTWVLIALVLFIIFFGVLDGPFGKMEEYLCDYYAAQRHGNLSIINALLTLGKRQELEEFITHEIVNRVKADNTLSTSQVAEILRAIDQTLSNKRMVAEEELKEAVITFFESDEIDKFRTELTDAEVESESQEIEKFIGEFFDKHDFQILDWNLFDFGEKDMRIDEAEYPHLIDALLKHPDAQLFNLAADNKPKTVDETHPTFGERILFLHKADHE